MPRGFFHAVRSSLQLAFEGELAALPAHERREQHRRQIQLLHLPLSNLLLALALFAGLQLGVASWADRALPPMALWQLGAVAVLVAMALAYRGIASLRRRRLLGMLFLGVLLGCLSVPGFAWRQDTLLTLSGFLLLPVAGLPLLVRPRVAFGGLALCTAVTLLLLFHLDSTAEKRWIFGFYYAMSVVAGLLLRRARANLATRLDQQVESLWQRAVSDPLTGLLNRHGWINLANTAMADALAADQRPAVLFLDVDHFKRTNDRHGHLVGDELLRALGRIVQARIGTGELSARLGGEEFACLLPHASEAQAERFAERLAADYRQQAREFGSTISVGIATYAPGDVLNDLLARADAALYEAKHRGRDQVIVARNHPVPPPPLL